MHYSKFEMRDGADGDVRLAVEKPWVSNGIYRQFFKRFMDIILVLLAAPVIVPVVLFLAILIKRDGGAAFYSQERVGKDGRHFTCWKLRSMVVNADQKLAEYLAANPTAKTEWDITQKLRNDPRITKIGHFIRKSSIDELPQLWCVLKGDMSLVGPRPFTPDQKELYSGRAYYDLRPGLTGFWQVSERSQSSFAARVAHDTRYAADMSLGTDISIILRTVNVVFRATGV